MLLQRKPVKRLTRALLGTSAFLALFVTALATGAVPNSLWKSLKLDPLLGHYLDSGCVLMVSVGLDGDLPVLNGSFRVLTPDNKVVIEGTFRNNRLEGDLKTFGSSGTVSAIERYKNGRPTGERIEWDEAGNVSVVTPYSDEGKKTGVERFYTEGTLQMEIDWQNGTPSEIRSFKDGMAVERLRGQAMWDRLKAKMAQAGEIGK